MPLDEALILYDPEVVKQLLCSAYRECRDNDIAAPVQSGLDYPCELRNIIRRLRMHAVAVCGFADDVVSMRRILRRLYERLVDISEVAREQYRSLSPILVQSEENIR